MKVVSLVGAAHRLVTCVCPQVFTNGGSWSGDDIINVGCCVNKEAEVYDPPSGTWRQLTGISSVEMLSDDPEGRQQQDYYGFFFAWTGATGARKLSHCSLFDTRSCCSVNILMSVHYHCSYVYLHSLGVPL